MSSKSKIWYGYLEAGDKSSFVAMDPKLDTVNPKTVYLFNLKRNQVLEYQREIVEPKLRELKPKEEKSIDELSKAFTKAKKDFTPRRVATKILAETPTITPDVPAKKAPIVSSGDDDIDLDVDIEIDDIDLDDEEDLELDDTD